MLCAAAAAWPTPAAAQYALDAPRAIACSTPESPMVSRMRRTRNVAWATAAVGVGTLIAAYPLEQTWMIGTGATLTGGGFLVGLWAGTLLRRRCRGVEAFDQRFGRRARITGSVLVGLGSALAVTGVVIIVTQPFDAGDDPAIVNGFLGGLGFILPGVVVAGTGFGLRRMARGSREDPHPRTQAFLGPGTLTVRTSW